MKTYFNDCNTPLLKGDVKIIAYIVNLLTWLYRYFAKTKNKASRINPGERASKTYIFASAFLSNYLGLQLYYFRHQYTECMENSFA